MDVKFEGKIVLKTNRSSKNSLSCSILTLRNEF